MFSLAERLKLIASGEGKARLFNLAQKLSLVLLTTSLSSFLAISPVRATNYYVSLQGNGTNPKTWQGAWSGLSQVNNNVLQPGDTLIFDGGSKGMVYNGTLQIAFPDNLTVQQATDSGRNGQVIFDGKSTTSYGIQLYSHNTKISGNGPSGFLIRNYAIGIYTDAFATGLSVNNVEVTGCRVGAEVGGGVSFNMLFAHDNILQAIQRQQNDTNAAIAFTNCAFYNTTVPQAGAYSCGFESYLDVAGNVTIDRSIFGPYLTHGVYLTSHINAKIRNCLMLAATNTNFYVDSRPANVLIQDVTSFMPPTDPYGFAHSAILAWQYPAKLQILDSVFWGGVIQMPLLKFGKNVFEWFVTGNLTALADKQMDPKFKNDVTSIPSNARASLYMTTSFALDPTSKATGSSVTSFADLLH